MELFLSQKVIYLQETPAFSESLKERKAILDKQEMPLTQTTRTTNKVYKIENLLSPFSKMKKLSTLDRTLKLLLLNRSLRVSQL